MFNRLWQYLQDTDLYFRLFERRHLKLKLSGTCRCCGECCRQLVLHYLGRPVRNEKQYKRLLKISPAYARFLPNGQEYKDGIMRFCCKDLQDDNRCGVYADRPEMCQRYPDPDMLRWGGSLINGCGYSLEPEQGFDDLLDEQMEADG
jgi:Fe-S-cluster containining protein